jgi:Uncharacterised protein family UPF0547
MKEALLGIIISLAVYGGMIYGVARTAEGRGRRSWPWGLLAAVIGVFALIPLLILPKCRHALPALEASHVDGSDEALAWRYRRMADEGQLVETTPAALVRSFGYADDTQEARETVADMLWEAGLWTRPSLSETSALTKLQIARVDDRLQTQPENRGSYATNPIGVVTTVVGGLLLALSVFLPLDQPGTMFRNVQSNTLIQHEGWLLLIVAVILIAMTLRSYLSGRRAGWSVLILALVSVAIVVYLAQDKSARTLYPLNSSGEPETSAGGHVVPLGIAIYVAAVGAVLAVVGGWVMRQGTELTRRAESTKQCPDCAETVLVQARVCKHCGYRFSAATGDATASEHTVMSPTEDEGA